MERQNSSPAEMTKSVYPGYPTDRLVIKDAHLREDLTLPDGPWTASVNIFPDNHLQRKLKRAGYELDALGRPLHPWLRDMLADPNVGVVTGLGEYWNWGPNRTADPIVLNNDPVPKVLLIQRGDTGGWALPGGFIDGDENPETAAKRELMEETNLLILGSNGQETYRGVVADSRATAHAWAETAAYVWQVEGTPIVSAGDDAQNVQWFSVEDLPDTLHGSHAALLADAVAVNHTLSPNHAVHLPIECSSYSYINGGHMAYHHLLVTAPSDEQYFVKSHDKHFFTEPTREAHSRQYLEKEKRMYDHVRQHGFAAIPENVDLIDNHTLMMKALHTGDGWTWRVPQENTDQYITDTLQALYALESIPLPDDFHDTILPTLETHSVEGWQDLGDEKIPLAQKRIDEWLPRFHSDFQKSAIRLSESLNELRDQFSTLPPSREFVTAHHDARQANVAWHPDYGTKIVDWSWAGAGRTKSDTTTFLIDLHKSGIDVSSYADDFFSPEHALTMIGFWLAHSLWPTRDDDNSVRFHQAASAVAAYSLLENRQRRIQPIPLQV